MCTGPPGLVNGGVILHHGQSDEEEKGTAIFKIRIEILVSVILPCGAAIVTTPSLYQSPCIL